MNASARFMTLDRSIDSNIRGRTAQTPNDGTGMAFDPPTPWKPSGPNEQPSTLPKDSAGQAINPQRRELNAAIEAFRAKHGREPTKKERRLLGRG
jgi:hypothetical protein